jgi:hypothetical protein
VQLHLHLHVIRAFIARSGVMEEQRAGLCFPVLCEGSVMNLHEDIFDELVGDGMIIIDGQTVATIPYSLSVTPTPGPLIAEGSISGPESLMRRLKTARDIKLALEDGPVVSLRCEGGQSGTRWVKALKAT